MKNDYYYNTDENSDDLNLQDSIFDDNLYNNEPMPMQNDLDIGSYYNNGTLTRHQYLKGADYREKRFFLRFFGVIAGLMMAVDIWRLYLYNIDYDIEDYFWFVGISFFIIVVLEVLVQLFGFKWCAIGELVLSLFMVCRAFSLIISVLPIGSLLMIVFGYHIAQTSEFEKMYAHYLKLSSIGQ